MKRRFTLYHSVCLGQIIPISVKGDSMLVHGIFQFAYLENGRAKLLSLYCSLWQKSCLLFVPIIHSDKRNNCSKLVNDIQTCTILNSRYWTGQGGWWDFLISFSWKFCRIPTVKAIIQLFVFLDQKLSAYSKYIK